MVFWWEFYLIACCPYMLALSRVRPVICCMLTATFRQRHVDQGLDQGLILVLYDSMSTVSLKHKCHLRAFFARADHPFIASTWTLARCVSVHACAPSSFVRKSHEGNCLASVVLLCMRAWMGKCEIACAWREAGGRLGQASCRTGWHVGCSSAREFLGSHCRVCCRVTVFYPTHCISEEGAE